VTPARANPVDPTARTIATEIFIARDIADVWAVLVDFAAYGQWNPYIVRIDGEAKAGTVITVHAARMELQPALAQNIDLVSIFPYTMRWQGGLPDRSEFAGDHWFVLDAAGPDETRLKHYEHFTGSRVPQFGAGDEAAVVRNFERFNRALKARCEGGQIWNRRWEEKVECSFIKD